MLDFVLRTAIERRYTVLTLVLAIGGLGVWNFTKLPIDAVPDITNVQVQVNTPAPGYTPIEVEQRISYLVENAMAGLPSLDYTRSVSRYGVSQVTVVFEEGTDIYFARQQVSERLAAVRTELPTGIEPEMGPTATGLGEIFMFTVDNEAGAMNADGSPVTPMDLRTVHDWVIKPQLLRVSGVVEVNPIGGYVREVLVAPKPALLVSHGLTFEDIRIALLAGNANTGSGYIEQHGAQWLMRVPGQVEGLDGIRDIIINTRAGTPLKVGDVAEVSFSSKLRTGAATQNGREVVMSTVFMLIGENSREVALRVSDRLKEVNRSLPEGITATAVYDRTELVNKTLVTVRTNLLEGALLVIVILFLFLGNVRAALLTAAVMPFAMLMTVTGMVQARVSANLMSLGALDFGLIVDGAVIIVENCLRRLDETDERTRSNLKDRLALVFDATREVIRPALFGVFIITAVYLPIFSLSGIEGKMFHPMATTVVIALISAMLLSLTLIPAGIALFVKGSSSEGAGRITEGLKRLYRPVLTQAISRPMPVLLVAVVIVGVFGTFASRLGTEFIPNLDEGDIAMHALRIPGTSLSQAVSMQAELEATITQMPEVERVFAKIGTAEVATEAVPPSVADNFIIMKSRADWPDPGKTKDRFIRELEARVSVIPGNRYEFLQPIQMRFNELIAGVRAELAVNIYGDDFDELIAAGEAIGEAIGAVEGASDLVVEQTTGLPILSIVPRREALARHGILLTDLQAVIATAIAGKKAGTLYDGDVRTDIVVRLPEQLRSDVDRLGDLPVNRPDGKFVPLGELASFELSDGINQINRQNGKRRVVVTANVRGRDLGSFVTEVQERITQDVELPAGYWIEYAGTFEHLISASQRLAVVVPLTLTLILFLLTIALGSVRDSLIIFSGVPLALTGGIAALLLRDIPFSISAAVGFIALSGIAALNGIVMVSFIRDLQSKGKQLLGAITEGALTRLRPVLMTALVASLGFLPMALNTGIGAEVQRPLATVVIGGIITSTLLTLVVLPALYKVVHGFKTKI
jgi:heavy metal efflux system protein